MNRANYDSRSHLCLLNDHCLQIASDLIVEAGSSNREAFGRNGELSISMQVNTAGQDATRGGNIVCLVRRNSRFYDLNGTMDIQPRTETQLTTNSMF
jgi:hypothetical protein